MATVGSLAVASDIASAALEFYVRGPALAQTIQDKPLVKFLKGGQADFPGGKQYISEPVQGAFMSDTAGFFAGYTQDDALTFTQAANILRAQYAWKEVHAGFVITQTELKQDGISLTDGESSVSRHSDRMLTALTGILENRTADFGESYSRAFNTMLWGDGTQDSKQVPGVRALVTDSIAGTIGGLAQGTYTWWRNRFKTDIGFSTENQSLTKYLRNELIQLKRYGGRPNKALCGSAFWDALMQEVEHKGSYTETGFTKNNDIGMDSISLKGLGTFEYDPTLDEIGLSKRCYVFDSRRIKLRPMEGESDKLLKPARPYQYMVMLQSLTWTGGLQVTQLNCHGLYGIN